MGALPWEIIGCILVFVVFALGMVWAGSWLEQEFGEIWPQEGED